MRAILVLVQRVWLETARRKDAYLLLAVIALCLTLLAGVDLFGLHGSTVYIKELGLLLIWICAWLLAIAVSVRQLPQEEQQGTIFALLAKPVSRLQLLAGKWLGAWSIVAVVNLFFHLILWLIVLLRGGGLPSPLILLQALALHSAGLAVLTAIGLAFSTRLHTDAAATLTAALTGGAWLIVPRIPDLAVTVSGIQQTAMLVLYYALPHLELFDLRQRLAHNWPPAAGWAVLGSLLYALLLTIFFFLWAWAAYRRKKLSRGSLL